MNKSSDIFKFNFFVVIEKFFVNKSINIFKFKTFFIDKKLFEIKFFLKRRKITRIFMSKKNNKTFQKNIKKNVFNVIINNFDNFSTKNEKKKRFVQKKIDV